MTDTDKLKRLAEAASFGSQRYVISDGIAANILALIAERDEAVALLREWDRVGIDGTGGSNLEDSTEAFLARIDGNHQPAPDANPS